METLFMILTIVLLGINIFLVRKMKRREERFDTVFRNLRDSKTDFGSISFKGLNRLEPEDDYRKDWITYEEVMNSPASETEE